MTTHTPHAPANAKTLWQRYQERLIVCDDVNLSLDTSRIDFADGYVDSMKPLLAVAFKKMDELEAGAIANPDENRRVGHYWLRNADLAPDEETKRDVIDTLAQIHSLTADIHAGIVRPEKSARFSHIVVVGIGGSALGPQLAAAALGRLSGADKMTVSFVDNTDPDGIDLTFSKIGSLVSSTLTIVISKSGGTKETRNGMLEAEQYYERAGLHFAKHAVAVTGKGSELDKYAFKHGWLARVPMFDWVGGRTSELSAVGLLPAALQGIDIEAFLAGARAMDRATRIHDVAKNPAAMLSLVWHSETGGRGQRDMVVLPYKDRLELMSRYLQQLLMESLGKEHDLDGKVVHQGIAVYGNKGSTDQHAYVQQLRDGVHNFFTVFIEVLHDRKGERVEVESGITSGDYLFGFLQGTRRALYEKGRGSVTITIDDVTPASLGALIALFERTVGFYATLVNINAYHQPGVEVGKKAAAEVLSLQQAVVAALDDQAQSTEELAHKIGRPDDAETVYKILLHLSHNGTVARSGGRHPQQAKFARG